MIPSVDTNKSDTEYQVMLAILDFHRDYLALHYSHARIHTVDNVIEVTLTPRRAIPAEQLLAGSPEGRAQLQQMHTAAFRSGEAQLRDRLQRILGIAVEEFFTQLDLKSGINLVVVRLARHLDKEKTATSGQDNRVSPNTAEHAPPSSSAPEVTPPDHPPGGPGYAPLITEKCLFYH